ncbi:MAG: hypothetical protein ABI378_14830 [Chitinophagaceae bacterium]
MSVAEMKEAIVKTVVLSDDKQFLQELQDFIASNQKPNKVEEVDVFYDRLKGQYAEALQKLAQ